MAEEIGICDICCTPPATTRSCTPAMTPMARTTPPAARPALAVDGCAGNVLRQACGQPTGASDVAGLTADRVDIAEDDVFDSIRVDARAFEQGRDAGGTKIGGVDECESATSLSGGSADSVDDVSLGHGHSVAHQQRSAQDPVRSEHLARPGACDHVWSAVQTALVVPDRLGSAVLPSPHGRRSIPAAARRPRDIDQPPSRGWLGGAHHARGRSTHRVSAGALYQWFDGKDEIYAELFTARLNRGIAQFDAMPDDLPFDDVLASMLRWVQTTWITLGRWQLDYSEIARGREPGQARRR